MSKGATIPYPEGYTIKPYSIDSRGIVQFTDGTNTNVLPNEQQCIKYGYKFDRVTGTCYAWKPTVKLLDNVGNADNIVKGRDNKIAPALTTYVLGQGNEARDNTSNNMIIGCNNVITTDCENGLVIGTKANVTTSNSLTIGGNQGSDNLSERQTIILQYGCQTTGTGSGTGGGTISAGINNLVGTRFVLPENAIIYFHADTIAVRTGGTSASGAVGDFYSAVERGVMINKSGTCTISRERDTIKTSGTVTNWRVNSGVASDGKTLAFQCRGNNDMTIEWNMTVTITMIQTSVSL